MANQKNSQNSWKQWGNYQTGSGGSWRGYNPDPDLVQGSSSGFQLPGTLSSASGIPGRTIPSPAYQPNPYKYTGPTRTESAKLSEEYDQKMREIQAVNAMQAEKAAKSYPDWQFDDGLRDRPWKKYKHGIEEWEVDKLKNAEKDWTTKMWDQVKGMGLKDWGNLGVKGLEAWTGFKELEQAEKQHELAQETFGFQKAAWNKDFAGRKLAYNTDAQNVNAWKEAQGRTDFNKLMV